MKDWVTFLGEIYMFREEEGGNAKFLEILSRWLKRRSSEILADERMKRHFGVKSHTEKYNLRNFSWQTA